MTDDAQEQHTIADDAPLWRYMDVPKFLSMVTSGTLWFAKAAKLHDDPYEGFCRVTRPPFPSDEHGAKWLYRETAPGVSVEITVERMRAELARRQADYLENAREHLYVNSWCLGDESMAMWELYASSGWGVAIKSSVGQYRRAARFRVREEQHAFGGVRYHSDLASAGEVGFDLQGASSVYLPGPGLWGETLKLGFHKRSCYAHEREWRAALFGDSDKECIGYEIEFDLEELVSEVCVGPRAEPHVLNGVQAVLGKFGLRKPVTQSALLTPPERNAANGVKANAPRSRKSDDTP